MTGTLTPTELPYMTPFLKCTSSLEEYKSVEGHISEDNLSLRQPQAKISSVEDVLSGRLPQ